MNRATTNKTSLVSALGALSDLGGGGDIQRCLMNPPAGIRCPVPALERDGTDLIAFLVIENLEERAGKAGTNLGGRTAQVYQAFRTILEDGDGSPALRL